MKETDKHRVVFDRHDKKPYCVLLQAAMGGDYHAVSRYFDAQFWHVNPTEHPMGVEATGNELKDHNERLRAREA